MKEVKVAEEEDLKEENVVVKEEDEVLKDEDEAVKEEDLAQCSDLIEPEVGRDLGH